MKVIEFKAREAVMLVSGGKTGSAIVIPFGDDASEAVANAAYQRLREVSGEVAAVAWLRKRLEDAGE